jgi:organic radical activating enzyme
MNRFSKIYIEISNICNLQCTFCPVVERDKLVMPPSLFEKIASEVAPYTDQITLHVMGEPLAHPQFEEIVNITKNLKLKVNLTTNGILLKRYETLLLSSPHIHQINFSTHSFTDNFPDRDFRPYLMDLISFSQKLRAQDSETFVNFRLWNLRADEQTKGPNQLMLDELHRIFASSLPETVDPRSRKSYRIAPRTFVHFDSQFRWPNPLDPIRTTQGTCHGTLSHLAIHADGTLVPCCLDKEAVVALADLSALSFFEALNGSRLKAIQQGFRACELVEDLCQRCTFIERFDEKAQRQLAAKEK